MTLHIIVVISVIVLGILFLLIEIFLLPGISIAGIAGAIFLVGGIIYSYMFLGSTAGNISLAASAVALGLTFFGLLKSKSLDRISLNTNIDDKVDNSYLLKIAAGDTGVAISRLNPIGKILVNDIIAEGKSFDGEFIEENTEIVVTKVETYNVLVKRK
jgi:membrane-bound ClpP family serine protease